MYSLRVRQAIRGDAPLGIARELTAGGRLRLVLVRRDAAFERAERTRLHLRIEEIKHVARTMPPGPCQRSILMGRESLGEVQHKCATKIQRARRRRSAAAVTAATGEAACEGGNRGGNRGEEEDEARAAGDGGRAEGAEAAERHKQKPNRGCQHLGHEWDAVAATQDKASWERRVKERRLRNIRARESSTHKDRARAKTEMRHAAERRTALKYRRLSGKRTKANAKAKAKAKAKTKTKTKTKQVAQDNITCDNNAGRSKQNAASGAANAAHDPGPTATWMDAFTDEDVFHWSQAGTNHGDYNEAMHISGGHGYGDGSLTSIEDRESAVEGELDALNRRLALVRLKPLSRQLSARHARRRGIPGAAFNADGGPPQWGRLPSLKHADGPSASRVDLETHFQLRNERWQQQQQQQQQHQKFSAYVSADHGFSPVPSPPDLSAGPTAGNRVGGGLGDHPTNRSRLLRRPSFAAYPGDVVGRVH